MAITDSCRPANPARSIYAHFEPQISALGLPVDSDGVRQDLTGKPAFIRMRLLGEDRVFAGTVGSGGAYTGTWVQDLLAVDVFVRRPPGQGTVSGGADRPRQLAGQIKAILLAGREIPLNTYPAGIEIGRIKIGPIRGSRLIETGDYYHYALSFQVRWLEVEEK